MSSKLKPGTTVLLPVKIDDPDFEHIAAIEFIFKQNATSCGEAIKTAYWTPDGTCLNAQRKRGERVILVRFTREETYKFKRNATFYMDTRIRYQDAETNPITTPVALQMRDTLFEPGEEVEAGE